MNGGIGLDRLSLNQATVKRLGLREAVELCVRHEIPAIGLWRDRVAETGLARFALLERFFRRRDEAGKFYCATCLGAARPGP